MATGNRVADALLSEKLETAKKINTDIVFKGSIHPSLIAPIDICIIFGNALDNALEACGKFPLEQSKIILISSRFENNFLFIRIQNPVIIDIKVIGNKIATTKADANHHGIGLNSIEQAVKKYSGDMQVLCNNNVFTLELDLDLNLLSSKNTKNETIKNL